MAAFTLVTAPALTDAQSEYVDGLVALAKHLRANPASIPVYRPLRLHLFAITPDELRELSAAIGGRREKIVDGGFYEERRAFGPHTLSVNIGREQVCERVVVEVIHHDDETIPAHDEEIVEWVCPPDLTGAR